MITPLLQFSLESREYRYYFWASMDRTLIIIGVNSSTYRLHNLVKGGISKSLVLEGAIERMQMIVHEIAPGHYLLESSGRLTVIVCSRVGEDATIYFTSTNGNYVGHEFIFTPVSISDIPPTVLAFEDTRVTVYDSEGKRLQEFQLQQGQSKILSVALGQVFRVVSTGRIAIMEGGAKSGIPLVDARGMPVGKEFSAVIWGLTNPYILVVAYEPCKVSVYRGGVSVYEHVFSEEDVKSMRVWFQRVDRIHGYFHMVSTGLISIHTSVLRLQWGSEELMGKVFPTILGGQVGVPANLEYRVIVPGGGVIFTPFDTILKIDGGKVGLAADHYIDLPASESVHIIKANQPIIVQVRGTEDDDGFCVLSDRDLVFYELPKPSTEERAHTPWQVVIAAIVAIISLMALRIMLRRGRKPSSFNY